MDLLCDGRALKELEPMKSHIAPPSGHQLATRCFDSLGGHD
jgi:hypothetical protein